MYDPKKYAIQPSPKLGTTQKAKVTDVKEGKIRDFVSAGPGLDAWGDPNQACINVTAIGDDGAQRSVLMTLPKDIKVPEQSKLGQYHKTYGKYPEPGDSVNFKAVSGKKEGTFWDFVV